MTLPAPDELPYPDTDERDYEEEEYWREHHDEDPEPDEE